MQIKGARHYRHHRRLVSITLSDAKKPADERFEIGNCCIQKKAVLKN